MRRPGEGVEVPPRAPLGPRSVRWRPAGRLHAVRDVSVVALLSSWRASCRRLRRRLHHRAARARPRAGRIPRARPPLRPRSRPLAVRGGTGRGVRRGEAPPGARSRRGDLGPLHRADHPGHGRPRRHLCRRGRDGAALGAFGALRAVRRRAADPRRHPAPRAEDRAALELVAEPGGVRRPSWARRPTPCSPRARTGRRSRTSRSSSPCSSCSRSSRPRRRWWGTRSTRTSRARSPSGCRPCSSTGRGGIPEVEGRLDDLRGLAAALGLE